MGQRTATPTAQQFAYALGQPPHALGRNPQPSLALHGKAEPQELASPRPRHRTLLSVHTQVQDLLEEGPDPTHHALSRYPTADIDVAVIGVTAKGESPSFQLPVEIRQQDVGQERRERTALRRPLSARLDQPVLHHPRFQEPSDE